MADFDNKMNLTPRPIYPEPSPTSAASPEGGSASTFEAGTGSESVRPLDSQLPPRIDDNRLRNSLLSNDNEDIGDNARRIAERARDKFQVVAEGARDRMNDLTDRASNIADEAGQRLTDMRDRFNDRLPEWKRQARERVDDARIRARRTAVQADLKAKQYPIETIAAAAGAGFLLGATMRIWRSSRG